TRSTERTGLAPDQISGALGADDQRGPVPGTRPAQDAVGEVERDEERGGPRRVRALPDGMVQLFQTGGGGVPLALHPGEGTPYRFHGSCGCPTGVSHGDRDDVPL